MLFRSNHPEKTGHPCQFPVELVERCILALTDEDSWVLDPFAGVGSTNIAAIKNGRNAIGIDQSQEYIRLANDRIQDLRNGVLKTRPIHQPIHTPKSTDKVAQVPSEWEIIDSKVN